MRLSHLWHRSAVSTAAAALAAFGFTTAAQADSIKTVFVIAVSAHGGWSPPPSRCSSAPRGGCWDVYAPLQQLQTDLTNNTVANYNWITPNQYNDMHSTLSGGYKGLTGDAASIKQGDDFLSQIVPMIMASQAYQNDGAIMVWWDETEGTNANDFSHTLPFIVISPLAKGNDYSNTIDYTHSSTLRTLQEIFGVDGPFLGDAANATDLSDLFRAGAIPVSEPSSLNLAGAGLGALLWARRRRA